MSEGRPIFDGYLVGEPSGYPRINASTPAIANNDPRQKVQPIDVPVISLHTRPQEPYRRRPDGDQPNDRYRVYEVAGASHNNRRLRPIYMQTEDVFNASGCAHEPAGSRCITSSSRRSPGSTRGRQRMSLLRRRHMHGNPVGGLRSSYLDVPVARYYANAPAAGGSACTLDGAQELLTRQTLSSLYGNHAGYVSRVDRRVKELQREGGCSPPMRRSSARRQRSSAVSRAKTSVFTAPSRATRHNS